jgi:hypothetical protein
MTLNKDFAHSAIEFRGRRETVRRLMWFLREPTLRTFEQLSSS